MSKQQTKLPNGSKIEFGEVKNPLIGIEKPQQTEKWEEEFSQVWGGYNASEDTRGLDARIKDFIRSLLASQKAEMREKIGVHRLGVRN